MSIRNDWENFKNPVKQEILNTKNSIKDDISDIKYGNTEGGCLGKILFWGIIIILIAFLGKSCGNESIKQNNTASTSPQKNETSDKDLKEDSTIGTNLSYLEWQDHYASNNGISLNDFSEERKNILKNMDTINAKAVYMTKDNVLGANRYKMTSERSKYLYTGEVKDNYAEGFGILIKTSGFNYGAFEIEGKYYNYIYIGNFKEGRFSGYGIEFNEPEDNDYILFGNVCDLENSNEDYSRYYLGWLNYVKYEGMFEKGSKNGLGNGFQTYFDFRQKASAVIGEIPIDNVLYDEVLVGSFKDDKLSGNCKIYTVGQLEYDGEMRNGTKNGYGCYYNKGILKYEGEFKNDMKNGIGVLYDDDGNVVYQGEWLNDDYK